MVATLREAACDLASAIAKRTRYQRADDQTIYTWRKRFGGFGANDVRRLKRHRTSPARPQGDAGLRFGSRLGSFGALAAQRG